MELTVGQSVAGALGIALALAALHAAAPRLRRLPGVPERATGSFAGGIAVAYVFLHLLPELAEGNLAIGELLDDAVDETPLLDLGIFLVALAGFVLLFGLELLARRHAASSPAADDGPPDPPPGVFALHLGAFAVYNALITYTMPLRLRTGVAFAILFAVAMGLHFVLTDRGLAEAYPRRFRHYGRALLAAALLAGWLLAAVVEPTSTVVVSLLTAFLGGSILLNVFKEELRLDGRSSFRWFVTGVVLYSALLAWVTHLSA